MTSVVDTSVKFAVSSMQDAPLISGTAGTMITALDAFLINGFANKTVSSGVVSSGICRLNISGLSAAMAHSVILVAGITGTYAALNGEQKVTAVSSSWVEFKTDFPDGALAGSISFKMAPLGWEKVFAATNKAVYRPVDPRGTRPFIRIDDSNALYARVQMYESMSDVDTGVGVGPVLSGGYYWHKRSTASANGIYWMMIGDSRGCFVCPAPYEATTPASQNGYAVAGHYVGDLNSVKSGDAWCALLSGAASSSYSDTSGCMFQGGASTSRVVMRASHGLGGSVACDRNAFNTSEISGVSGALGAFPSRSDNGLRLAPIQVMDGVAANGPRGELPGAYFCVQTGVRDVFGSALRFTPGEASFSGKTLMSLTVGQTQGVVNNGLGWWSVNEPWRF